MTDNVSTITSLYEAFGKGDIPTVLGGMSPKVEWNEAENVTYDIGSSIIGPDAVLENVIGRIPNDFDEFHLDIGEVHDAGDTVIVEARYKGKGKATGKKLNAQVAHIWTLEKGKITKFQQYTDTWQFAQVTGITPGK